MQIIKRVWLLLLVLSVTFGCSKSSSIDFGKSLSKAESSLTKQQLVENTASSYNPDEKLVKFRLVVKSKIAKDEARALVGKFLDATASATQNQGTNKFFKPYNIAFDIIKSDGTLLFGGFKVANSSEIEWLGNY